MEINKQLFPYRLYVQGNKNMWLPSQVSLAKDKADYAQLSTMEKHYITYMLGFFSTAENLVANNIQDALVKHISDPTHKLYLMHQQYEEHNHAATFAYIIDSLDLDKNKIYAMHETVPEIKAKKDFEERFTSDLVSKDKISKQELFRNLFGFYAIMEGLYFFSGFLIGLSFGRRQVLRGISTLFQYILKDECHSDDTEILTPNGWVMFPDLKDGDPVYQYNSDGTMSKVIPDYVARNETHSDHLVLFEHERWAGLVTPNHDIVYNTTKNSELKKESAKDFKLSSGRQVPQIAKLRNKGRLLTDIERLQIALSADGHIQLTNLKNIRGVNGGYNIQFDLTKSRKKERLNGLLINSGLKFKRTEKGKVSIFNISLPNPDKSLTWVYKLNMNYDLAKDIVDEVLHWDGSIVNDNVGIFCTTDKANLDVIQWVATLAGYSTHIVKSVDNRKESYKDYYRLSIHKKPKEFISTQAITKTEISYKGKSYCVSVPSGMIITRYKGKIMIAGNTVHLGYGMQAMRELITENPELITPELELELRELMMRAVELESDYATVAMPEGILGLNKKYYLQYCQHIADRRMHALKLKPIYKVSNPAAWLMTQTDLPELTSFFEAQSANY